MVCSGTHIVEGSVEAGKVRHVLWQTWAAVGDQLKDVAPWTI